MGARLPNDGRKSPPRCLEYKGIGYFFEGKFLPEQTTWAEILLTEQTGRTVRPAGVFSHLALAAGERVFGRRSQADQLPYIQAHLILLHLADISVFTN